MTEMGKDYAFGRPELDVAIAPTAAIRVTAIEPQGSTQKGGSFKMTETAVRTLAVTAVGAKNGPIGWANR